MMKNRLKIALVNPASFPIYKIIDTNSLKVPEKRIPLGLLSLATVLKKSGFKAKIFDSCCQELNARETVDLVLAWEPDVVGISANSLNYPEAAAMIKMIYNICPEISLIMGGIFPTIFPQKVLFDLPELTAIFLGESELSLIEFSNKLEAGENDFSAINGVVSKKDNLKNNFVCTIVENLDDIPCPDYSLINFEDYNQSGSTIRQKPVITYSSSRGCPFKCSFCGFPKKMKIHRVRSAELIIKDLLDLKKKTLFNGVYFREDNFTCDKNRLNKFCQLMLEAKVPFFWECESRVDSVGFEDLRLMKEAGCRGIWTGVESGSERILKKMNKSITLKDIYSFFENCKTLDINTGAMFILGFPGENDEDVRKTINVASEINAGWTGFQTFVAFPESPIYNQILREGLWVREWNGILEVNTKSMPSHKVMRLEKELREKFLK